MSSETYDLEKSALIQVKNLWLSHGRERLGWPPFCCKANTVSGAPSLSEVHCHPRSCPGGQHVRKGDAKSTRLLTQGIPPHTQALMGETSFLPQVHHSTCRSSHTHTPVSRLCFFDTLWFFGLTDSLCLAALLSRRAMARGMASRLTLSMVPAEEKCLFGRDGLTGATYDGD